MTRIVTRFCRRNFTRNQTSKDCAISQCYSYYTCGEYKVPTNEHKVKRNIHLMSSNFNSSGGSRISLTWGRKPSRGWGRQNTILPTVPKNCMRLKEFGPLGGSSKILLCRSATEKIINLEVEILLKFYLWR